MGHNENLLAALSLMVQQGSKFMMWKTRGPTRVNMLTSWGVQMSHRLLLCLSSCIHSLDPLIILLENDKMIERFHTHSQNCSDNTRLIRGYCGVEKSNHVKKDREEYVESKRRKMYSVKDR